MSINNILDRGVNQILPSKKELEKLMNKRKITLYQGFDPTADSLHIGHFIGLRKLAQFQELGHKVIFLIGDFTAMIGDPTDKSATRQKLSPGEIRKNFKNYKKQASKLVRFEGENKAEVKFNSEWLGKFNFEEVLELSSNFTVQQMLERDFFQTRLKKQKPIYLHEFLYPLMQGYDSVAMNVDLEVGGNDQLFNMMAGRTLLKSAKNKQKFVLTMKLLTDANGKKMGKTEDNAIFLSDSPSDIYGKIMAMPDTFLPQAVELLTDLQLDFYKKHNALETKKRIALEVVEQIYDKPKAQEAQSYFENAFQKGNLPEKIPVIKIEERSLNIIDLIDKSDLISSRSQIKRLVKQGAISINGEKITAIDSEISVSKNLIIKIGKKDYVKYKKS